MNAHILFGGDSLMNETKVIWSYSDDELPSVTSLSHRAIETLISALSGDLGKGRRVQLLESTSTPTNFLPKHKEAIYKISSWMLTNHCSSYWKEIETIPELGANKVFVASIQSRKCSLPRTQIQIQHCGLSEFIILHRAYFENFKVVHLQIFCSRHE